jgi:hypothetical protein|tara:strand:- start:10291 stop:10470 length:180 start_codon:yes stop_codon:yes gene_type:complete
MNLTGLYHHLTDNALQTVASGRFGQALQPLKEIGREAVIKELEAYDRFVEVKEREEEER